jgi:hypothetical protein
MGGNYTGCQQRESQTNNKSGIIANDVSKKTQHFIEYTVRTKRRHGTGHRGGNEAVSPIAGEILNWVRIGIIPVDLTQLDSTVDSIP